jgi:predicted RNA binding protein with dsRBD fold (UPF0201 family)
MNDFGKVKIRIKVLVNHTENVDKIKVALQNMIGETNLALKNEEDKKLLLCKTENLKILERFRDLLRREQIMNAAKKVFLSGLNSGIITFHLNKQVAYVGHVSFSQSEGESPLGPISFEIQCEKPKKLIKWLSS